MAYNLPALSNDNGFQSYMAKINKFPILNADEEYMLAKRWSEHSDYDAAHKLVTSHLRLVAKIASGFKGYGLPITDLIAEGSIGLMQAVKKFDPERGFRLSTYAMWWIKASIQEYILRSWSLVKVGSSATQKRLFFNLRRLKKHIGVMEQGENLYPEQITEIANELDVSEGEVIAMDNRMGASDQYLDAPVNRNGEGTTGVELLASPDKTQEEQLEETQLQNQSHNILNQALSSLNERERDIIIKRRLSDPVVTLDNLSKHYGVSRERIRQIENRAMEKLTEKVKLLAG